MGTPANRYHICDETLQELIATTARKACAFTLATDMATERQHECSVFDSMARIGAPQLWRCGSRCLQIVERRKAEKGGVT